MGVLELFTKDSRGKLLRLEPTRDMDGVVKVTSNLDLILNLRILNP
jgi:hypothetical protein